MQFLKFIAGWRRNCRHDQRRVGQPPHHEYLQHQAEHSIPGGTTISAGQNGR